MSDLKVEKHEKPTTKSKTAEQEEEILKFWQEKEIFKKTLEKPSKGEYIFYDGPPFATGLPHYGHILAGTMKDYMGRYQTMRGLHVPRKWGWDTHGLPVENIVEKEIGLKSKKDIEDFGLEKFNGIARSKVFTYVDDWKHIIPRLGRFVDMDNDYRTMNPSFTESVWWVFKELHKKGLVYEGFKSMHLCPHCGTTLSNFEVTQGYKDITDLSVIGKFELADDRGTFFLAWTTTPWTLPGNVALAVGPDIEYVKIKIGDEFYILAESRISQIKDEYQITEKILGKNLEGILYRPLFDYYDNEKLENRENGYKVYAADFVTTEDGTGIVHIAPAFGEDDLKLGKEKKLPFIQHVGTDGSFKKEVSDFAGQKVKPIENPQLADIEIIKYLAGKGTLFAKEKFIHSYPHCYRCGTPLLNYATSSWFVEVTKFKDQLVEANKKIHWVPQEVGEGRFGKWLEGARDWAISRTRFWGAPLPVWRCVNEDCFDTEFIGGIDEIKKRTKKSNNFYMVRHGEAENNVNGILSSNPKTNHHLTEKGREQAKHASLAIDGMKIDIIYASPFLRTTETAQIIADGIHYDADKIIYDERLHEIFAGDFDGKQDEEYQAYFASREEKFTKTPPGGENYLQVKRRMTDFLYDMNEKNEGKNILIVSHNTPLWLLYAGAEGLTPKQAMAIREPGQPFLHNTEIKELPFAPIPHNREYELDLHRPFIDEIVFPCKKCGQKMKRIPEVFDCWFESGSMPYGQNHYPFENTDIFEPKKNIGFPADFIAEGLDQTRGWFYSMLVLSVALFGESSFKSVIVNGIVLAESGQKMSKSLKNYSDPMETVNKFSADAVRYYLLSSPAMKAEDLRFSDKSVDEISKKIIMRIQNVYSFLEMYGGTEIKEETFNPENILDIWIIAKLKETARQITNATNNHEFDKATRPIADFVDVISTWYVRRSRDRFKSENAADKNSAILTTQTILIELSKLLAPSMPFLAEDLYLKTTRGLKKESVHLEDWPEKILGDTTETENEVLENMKEVMRIVSAGLEARTKGQIKVRQPLQSLKVKSIVLKGNGEFHDLIKDEVNVKEIIFDALMENEVELDFRITEALKEEGTMRDILRTIQGMRKEENLNPQDAVALLVETENLAVKAIFHKFEKEISRVAGLKKISFENFPDGEIIDIDGAEIRLSIKK